MHVQEQALSVPNAPAERDLFADGAKGLLIILATVGHLIGVLAPNDPGLTAVNAAIYLFHMPLFILLAGMFSKASLAERDYTTIVVRLLIPLVVFQLLYSIPTMLEKGFSGLPVLVPYWHLWFIQSLILWRTMLPLALRIPYGVMFSVLVALWAGYNNSIGYAFSLSRTLYFFPFFLIGHLYGAQILSRAHEFRWLRASGFFALLLVAVWYSSGGMSNNILFGSMSYRKASILPEYPAIGRALVLAASFSASVTFLSLVPKRSSFLSYLGQRSLTIYLTHALLVYFVAYALSILNLRLSFPFLPLLLLLSVVIAVALAPLHTWFTRAFVFLESRMRSGSPSVAL